MSNKVLPIQEKRPEWLIKPGNILRDKEGMTYMLCVSNMVVVPGIDNYDLGTKRTYQYTAVCLQTGLPWKEEPKSIREAVEGLEYLGNDVSITIRFD